MRRFVVGTFGTCAAFSCSLVLALGGCGSAPRTAPAPPTLAPPAPSASAFAAAREKPPGPLEGRPAPFPAVARSTLNDGIRVSVVEGHALPVIEVRVIVHAGTGFGPPGVSQITARMLREGGTRAHTSSEIVERIEALGSEVDVAVGPDATRLSMRVVRDQLDEAMAILAEVVRTPRFDPAELTRVKARMADQSRDDARSSGTWMANRVLFHALFPAASPYFDHGVVPGDIAKVDGAAVRTFYDRFYVPSNVELVVAGDVDDDGAVKMVDRAFGDWKVPGSRPLAPIDFPQPMPVGPTRVVVANRPHSVQSDVLVTELLPDRHAPSWPTDRVALQVFGGGLTGRLFQDVREKRSLAYSATAYPLELAHDAQPLVAYAGTQAPKTAEAVQAILDTLAGMRSTPPSDDEVVSARRYLSDIFAVRMETIGAIADMVAQLRELDLPDDYWDTYRAALRAVTTPETAAEAAKIFVPDHTLVIVAGDADAIADSLTRFGDVTVVDPEHDFRILRTLPKSVATGGSGK